MDTRASPSPAASSASRNKPVASSSTPNNASLRQQNGTPQSSASAAGPVASSKSPRKPPSNAAASSSKGPVEDAKPTRNSSNSSLKAKTLKKTEDTQKVSKNEELLQAYRSDFDSLRALVTCKICDRLLYEPYTVACGHIYCYSCLSQWFTNNKKKTCPDCRTAITQVPAPTYLVREMIQVFISRADHLPQGETLEQHAAWQKDEAEIVKKDKENPDPRTGGLFKGVFSRHGNAMFAIRDHEDGVERCPLCGWELEDGECSRCGLGFDEHGLAFDNVGAFSDMDETSELDMSAEDIDAEMDDEYPEEFDFDALDEAWGAVWDENLSDDETRVRVRRWVATGGAAAHPTLGVNVRRRPAAHSAAGSRRRYTPSLASEVITEDMETLQEEEEDDMDEDSSMNDFIDDGQTEDGSQVTSTTTSQTPQPRPSRRGPQRMPRRVVESETSSNVSQATEDDDDEGPVPPGRRRQQVHNRTLARANGSRRTASSTSTETSAGNDLEEDTQALLRADGWAPLAQDGTDEMEEDGDDSDGGRTTVGWEPTANSNDRVPVAISLTPVADRPSHQSRNPPQVGARRIPDGSRGLRRRSSGLSVSTVHYEDGEADDDDSEVDRDGDTNMSGSTNLRPRSSRIRLRQVPQGQQNDGHVHRVPNAGETIDLDTDDNSDTLVAPSRRVNARARQREYDPRISLLFANHQTIMREFELPEPFRATTPLARPRTANRNRIPPQSPGISFVPSGLRAPPTQLDARIPSVPSGAPIAPSSRRGSVESVSNASIVTPSSRSERTNSIGSGAPLSEGTNSDNGVRLDREVPGELANSNRSSAIAPTTAQTTLANAHGISQTVTAGPADIIDRPMSRLNARPPSTTGRRPSGPHVISQGFPMSQGVGLNFAQRTAWQAQTRNPYWPFVHEYQTAPRPRSSTRTLREQSSTATLRPRNSQRGLRPQTSRAEVRDNTAQPQNPRSPQSQAPYNLRQQPSVRRLNAQPSTRALRGMHPTPAPATTTTNGANTDLTQLDDERRQRIQAAIRSRLEVLQATTTNPFSGARRMSSVSGTSGSYSQLAGQPAVRPESGGASLPRTESTRSTAVQPAPQTNATPASPGLGRRRSNRSLGLPPGAFIIQTPPSQRIRGGLPYSARDEHPNINPTQIRTSMPVSAADYIQ